MSLLGAGAGGAVARMPPMPVSMQEDGPTRGKYSPADGPGLSLRCVVVELLARRRSPPFPPSAEAWDALEAENSRRCVDSFPPLGDFYGITLPSSPLQPADWPRLDRGRGRRHPWHGSRARQHRWRRRRGAVVVPRCGAGGEPQPAGGHRVRGPVPPVRDGPHPDRGQPELHADDGVPAGEEGAGYRRWGRADDSALGDRRRAGRGELVTAVLRRCSVGGTCLGGRALALGGLPTAL